MAPSRVSNRVCRHFLKPSGCPFGSKCKFLHTNETNNSPQNVAADRAVPSQSNRAQDGEKDKSRDELVQWRFQIPLQVNRAQPLGIRLPSFLKGALNLIGSNPGITQEVITALASEGGLLRLQELLNRDFDNESKEQTAIVLEHQLLPFFKIITHLDVASSIIMEDKVGLIYNYLYGRQGERGLRVFEFVHRALAVLQPTTTSLTTLEPILLTFSNMIDKNNHALVNEDLQQLGELLLDTCDQLEQVDTTYLQRLTARIGRRLGIAAGIVTVETVDQYTTRRVAEFDLTVDPPGELSPLGPRHDNDHADIKDIQVLPTVAEIKAVRPPHLPTTDPTQSHLPGISGLLDRHFRLLREDTVGQLRDVIAAELNRKKASKDSKTRIFTYDDLTVTDVGFSRMKGLQLHVRFRQPQNVRAMTPQDRKDWWNHSKRLSIDSLVCVIDQHESVTFCTVSDVSHASATKPRSRNEQQDTKEDQGKYKNLFNDGRVCHIQLQLINTGTEAEKVLETLQSFHMTDTEFRLVEFPGVLLPSFLPTLEALKTMSQGSDIPFTEFLAHESDAHPAMIPPLYAARRKFEFELQPAMKDNVYCKLSLDQDFDLHTFKANSSLDAAQAEALINALHRSLALIQGPPGTGKSFTGVALIKVLLQIAQKAKLGPIICVCFTNHALDQLLEHLVAHDVKQIIRIGSQSKSEVLEKCNLRQIVQNVQPTKPEKSERWEIYQELESYEKSIEITLGRLKHDLSLKHLDFFFAIDIRSITNSFSVVKPKADKQLRRWLTSENPTIPSSHRPITKLFNIDLFAMTRSERAILHHYWLKEIKTSFLEQLATAVAAHQRKKSQLDRIRNDQELRCLQEANVIGVTTTGLARQLDLLRKLPSKVLVCEEAGEVLEAHLLTALLPSLEHLILIGDHLQLPPHIQNYNLSRANKSGEQYSLDVSLFERLVTPDASRPALPLSVLEVQRRMHPSISALIRSTLYPELQDSPHVDTYPGVAGMKERLYWFDHRFFEPAKDANINVTSRTHQFEVEMVVALVTHLVRQGVYAANDIAILTPYLGQLLQLRRALRNQFEITMSEGDEEEIQRQALEEESDIHRPDQNATKTALLNSLAVSTVDNFQGEEAKIVIISLVRSNKERNCGFLKSSNRINVLLSRAKHGMYIIGNSETAESAEMWRVVIGMLRDTGKIGPTIELECPRHPEPAIVVSKPEDFVVFSPEGGCGRICNKRLNCGHRDVSKCHSEMLHQAVRCLEPCVRQMKGCRHGCPKLCGDACIKKCQVVLKNAQLELSCGHFKSDPTCWQTQHADLVQCQVMANKKIPGCEHQVKLECFIDVQAENFECKAVCGVQLPCGHDCLRPCHTCTRRANGIIQSRNHGSCKKVCGRNFSTCKHSCLMVCHGDTPCECKAKCDNFCEHSHCGKMCEDACAPCAETKCESSRCPHTKPCSMPCAAPCDWLPCERRCEKLLSCGHRCPTVCGEACPSSKYCQICASPNVKNLTVDFLMMSTYEEIDLDEDPCVIPACGHILAISSMDGQMEMSKFYAMDGNVVTSIKDDSEPFSMDDLKVCGTCRGSLRNISRYGLIVRRALLDESTKKFIRRAGLRTIELNTILLNEQQKLDSSKEAAKAGISQLTDFNSKLTGDLLQQINQVNKGVLAKRYTGIKTLRAKIDQHLKQVRTEEQPFWRVLDLVKYAQQHDSDVGTMNIGVGVLQTRETVQALSMLHRCDLALLSDYQNKKEKFGVTVDVQAHRASCDELIQMSAQAKQPLQEVEGHLFYAQYCAAARHMKDVTCIDDSIQAARDHLAKAEVLCNQYPGTTRHAQAELAAVEKMLRESTFYTTVRDEEYREVMRAMAREFRGGGHWYTCANGHPFTVGECGMPMQQAVCPQCGANIGGIDHRPAEGVRYATDLEERFGGLHM